MKNHRFCIMLNVLNVKTFLILDLSFSPPSLVGPISGALIYIRSVQLELPSRPIFHRFLQVVRINVFTLNG